MADPISPEQMAAFTDAINNFTNSMSGAKQHVDEFGNAISESEAKRRAQQARDKAALDKYNAELEKFSSKISNAGNKIVSSMSGLSSPDGAFSALGNIAGDVVKGLTSLAGGFGAAGAAIKGLGEVAGNVVKMMTQETQKAFNTFNKISGSGVVASFTDMRQTARRAGLTFEEFGAALTQNSEALAAFGQGAIDGGKKMADILARNSGQAALNMQKMGVTAQEFAEIQTAYIAQQTALGTTRGKSDKQLAEESAKYAEELTVLSRLTGKSRADLQKEQQRQMNDARFRAKLASLPVEEAKKLQMGMSMFKGNVQKGLMDVIASGGALSSKESQELALQLGNAGVNLQELSQQYNSGQITMDQMFQTVSKGAADYVEANKGQVALVGPQGPLFSNFVDLADQAKFSGMSMEEARKATEKQVEEQKKQGDATADVAKKAHDLSMKFQNLATETGAMMKGLGLMADGIDKMLDVLESVTGEQLKKTAKYAGVGSVIGGALGLAAGAGLGFVTGGPMGAVAGGSLGLEYGMAGGSAAGTWLASKKGGVGSGGQPGPQSPDRRMGNWRATSPGANEQPAAPTEGSKTPDLAPISSKSGLSTKVGAQFAPSFQKLIDYLDESGYKINSLGGYIDRDVRGQPGQKSIHAYGGAIDINPGANPMGPQLITDMPEGISNVAAQLGLGWGGNWTSKKDAMHFSAAQSEGGSLLKAADGAMVEPTSGGKLVQVAEAGLPEAIIPMPDGKTIPVSLKNSSELVGRLDTQNMLLTEVVRLLTKGNRIQGNIASNMA